jgi:HEAT repeat protein
VIGAGTAARVLAKCINLPADVRVGAVLPRFVQAVVSPVPVEPVRYVYVSPRVYALNQFLLAFSYIGEPAVAPLQAQRAGATDPELRKWLILALGMAGEAGVAGELEEVVRNDPDRYVRCTAVRAYARSAGVGAISLLRSLLTDETESEYGRDPLGNPYRLIAGVARDELSRLELGGVRP